MKIHPIKIKTRKGDVELNPVLVVAIHCITDIPAVAIDTANRETHWVEDLDSIYELQQEFGFHFVGKFARAKTVTIYPYSKP